MNTNDMTNISISHFFSHPAIHYSLNSLGWYACNALGGSSNKYNPFESSLTWQLGRKLTQAKVTLDSHNQKT